MEGGGIAIWDLSSKDKILALFILQRSLQNGKVDYVFIDYNFVCIVDVGYFMVMVNILSFMCVLLAWVDDYVTPISSLV